MTALASVPLAARARHHDAPPHVADDDPPSSLALLLEELAPRPGRLASTLRITACALIVITLSETFQVSNVSLNAYLVFILFKADANASVRVSIVGAVAIVLAILLAIVLFAATLSEPALRIALIAVVTFIAMFLMRGSTLGVGAFVAGIFITSSLNDGDNLESVASGSYYPTNTDSHGPPSFLFISPEEALVHNLLFEALGVVLAVLVIVVVNKLTASDPEKDLRAALADRIAAAAAFCAGDEGARHRLAAFARAGTASLSAQSALLGQVKRVPQLVAAGDKVIISIGRLVPTLLAFQRLPKPERDERALTVWARPLSACAAAVRRGNASERSVASDVVSTPAQSSSPAAAPLLAQVGDCVAALQAALRGPREPAGQKRGLGFFKKDAFSEPATTQFALKTTLALMACYVFMNLTDWSQISTCMTTCFVVSLETAGQSFFKMISRVTGAAIGAAIGFLAILYVMPILTDIGLLLLLLAPVLLASAWVRAGGERTNYIGQQMAFAFMLMVLQNYGPTLDYDSGRDRVVGILVGDVAVTVVFTQLWPVRVADGVRKRVGDALAALGDALSAETVSQAGVAGVRAFAAQIGAARGLLVDNPYEPEDLFRRRGKIDGDVLGALQATSVPLAIIIATAASTAPEDERLAEHRRALAGWLRRAAAWVRHGHDGRALTQTLPSPPELRILTELEDREVLAARDWYAILDRELREVLRKARVGGTDARLA